MLSASVSQGKMMPNESFIASILREFILMLLCTVTSASNKVVATYYHICVIKVEFWLSCINMAPIT